MVLKSLLRKSFLISGIVVLLHSCNKTTSSDYPQEASCEMYAGKYEMYDPDSNITYNLVVECNPFNSSETNSFDSVTFNNYANLFNVDNRIDGNKVLDGDNIQPLEDKFGRNWSFSNNYYPDFENRINVMVGDSIYLYFQIDNTAYWMDEGVPYQSITSVHGGKKIH